VLVKRVHILGVTTRNVRCCPLRQHAGYRRRLCHCCPLEYCRAAARLGRWSPRLWSVV
jgi:hypothetical protein